jgi:putative spermidine/putrescine transport system ATP-binding protein/spermidine/putrescine transport system ATP-binding protein
VGRVPQRLNATNHVRRPEKIHPDGERPSAYPENAVLEHDLQLINIGKVYDNGTPAVIEFNLEVRKGEFIAFLGPSGCGKTTTLRMIAGFESITSGDLLLRGQRINALQPEKRPTSMIFQSYALFPHMTVRGNVAYGLRVKGMARKEIDTRVDRILDKLGLADLADQSAEKLSGGQRQRIALARGLVVEPSILLLDEPLGALDANLRKSIQAELKLLQRNLGITFVFVTHAQSEALTMSDRIVVMNRGRIEQVSTPFELYTRPATPFVAQFIGNNTILDGTALDTPGAVQTGFGTYQGRPARAVTSNARAKLVVPSEALDVHPAADVTRQQLEGQFAGNVLPGILERREIVGHILQMTIRLAGGQVVLIDGHVDKYGHERLAPPADIWISWKPEDATVMAA